MMLYLKRIFKCNIKEIFKRMFFFASCSYLLREQGLLLHVSNCYLGTSINDRNIL